MRGIVRDEEVPPPPTAVVDVDRHRGAISCWTPALNCQSQLRTPQPSCVSGLTRRGRPLLPQVQVAPRQALTVAGRIEVVAVGDEVAVAVGPAAGVMSGPWSSLPACARTLRYRLTRVRRLQILAHADLDRRPAVAEQVVGAAHPRRDVVVRRSRRPSVGTGRPARTGARRSRSRLPGRSCDVLVAKAALERQPAPRPLVLGEEGMRHDAVAAQRLADAAASIGSAPHC